MTDTLNIRPTSFEAIIKMAETKVADTKPRAAVLCPEIDDTVEAVQAATERGLIEPLIIENQPPEEVVHEAARLVDAGEIQCLIIDNMATTDLLLSLIRMDSPFRVRRNIMSHVALFIPPTHPKPILLSDGCINPNPDLKTKVDLITNLVTVANSIDIFNPKIAVVAAVEIIYPQMQATTEGAVLAKMSDRGQITDALIDGPLSFDVAIDPEAAAAKGIIDSQVAGHADAILAPDIETANGIYHAMSLYGKCEIGGIIMGGKVPVAINAYADSVASRLNSIALAVLSS